MPLGCLLKYAYGTRSEAKRGRLLEQKSFLLHCVAVCEDAQRAALQVRPLTHRRRLPPLLG
jgi:hypothetical protein